MAHHKYKHPPHAHFRFRHEPGAFADNMLDPQALELASEGVPVFGGRNGVHLQYPDYSERMQHAMRQTRHAFGLNTGMRAER